MLKYILKRLGLAILILVGVSLILYILVRLMPVDFVRNKIAAINVSGVTPDEGYVQALYKLYGLGDNSFKGILAGYGTWLWNLCRLDLGNTWSTGVPVITEIADHMTVSFVVALRDYVVTVIVMVGISLPSFFLGRFLQSVFSMRLGWFPPSGLVDGTMNYSGFAYIGDYLWHIFLPLLVMVLLSIGGTMRYMRTNMLEVLNSDYIRTARAKGLPEKKVIYKHAFRNTMIPIVTMLAGVLPSLFSGAMITEQVFDLPGIGGFALDAMNHGDIPFIMGYNMFLALLSVIGVLLTDLMYAVVDPRVKLY